MAFRLILKNGPPCENRTHNRPLGGDRYIHLTNEGTDGSLSQSHVN